MSMYFVLLRTIERMQDDRIQKSHTLLMNTGIDAQYVDQEAIVEDRSIFLGGKKKWCSNRNFEESCSKVFKSDC